VVPDLITVGGLTVDNIIAAVREAVPGRPLLIGGGVSNANIAEALVASDGVIVSSALMRPDAAEDDLLQWDAERCLRFMDAVGAA